MLSSVFSGVSQHFIVLLVNQRRPKNHYQLDESWMIQRCASEQRSSCVVWAIKPTLGPKRDLDESEHGRQWAPSKHQGVSDER